MPVPTRIPHLASILVVDGRKAVLHANHGDATIPDLRVEEVLEAPQNPSTHLQGADRPGRSVRSNSPRSAVGQTDWHAEAETAFAATVAALLDRRHKANPFHALIIAAPPRFLGDLRKHLSDGVRARVVRELHKDLTHLPVSELDRALAAD